MKKASQKFLWSLAVRNVFRQRRRSVVCILTIGTGVLCLLLFEGFNQGALWEYQERVVHTRMGHFQLSKDAPADSLSTDVEDVLFENVQQLEEKIKQDDRVQETFPRLRVSGLLTNDKRTLPVMAEGVSPEKENPFFNELDYLTGTDLKASQPDGVILGEGIAKALGVKVGDRVTLLANTLDGALNAVDLSVSGTFRSGVKEFDESFIRMHLAAAQELLQTEGVSSLVVGLKESKFFGGFSEWIKSLSFEGLVLKDFIELDDVYYGNSVRWLKAQFLFIRLIIYLVVIMGILNTVVISVHERTAEIGTLRAMGFGRSFVMLQFIREYFLLGLAGAVLGVCVAFLLAKLVLFGGVPMPASPGATKGLMVVLRLGPDHVVLNTLAATLSALLACYFPVRKALEKSIVGALQPRI